MFLRPFLLIFVLIILTIVGGCSSKSDDASATVIPSEGTLTPEAIDLPKLPPEAPEELKAIWEVYQILRQEFVNKDSIDPKILSEGAIQGMLKALDDPHTSYLTPEYFEFESENLGGSFQGIGAEVYQRGDRIILSPMGDGPANKAGIKAGDVVLEVDGMDTEGWTTLDAVRNIRGPAGTVVSLKIQHLGAPDPEIIEITRGVIPLESVSWNMMRDNIAYIRISSFYENTDENFIDVLKKAKSQGAKGIVLDLRNNPGGLLSSTVNVASQFLNRGKLVMYEIDGRGRRTSYSAQAGGLALDIPTVVLVDGFAASGSEILAGALQDHSRAKIVGTTTFGKGSVNQFRSLSDGGGLYYTFALWYTPNGRLIEGKGLEPDVVINPTGRQGDAQLEKAVEVLKEELG